jgi:hypothetical protein
MVPGILREAAVKHGLAADAYDKEIEFATNVVKTCAQIQPWMAEDSSSDPAGPKKDVYSIARTYGQQYMICQKLDSAKHMYFTGSGVDGVAHLAEDISMSSNQQTGPPSWVHPGHPDVGLGIYQSADHLWSEGKGFYLVLEVVSQDRSVDELLSDVHIDRSPDASINSYLVRARNHAAKADYHAAIGEFKQALIIDKDNQTAKDGLAAAQAALLRLPGEIDQYARAGEWLDLSSGLLWTLKDSDHRVNWDGAVNYCQSLQTGGASNWRLPSIEELRAIQVPETDAGIKGGIALQDKGETIWSLSSDVTPYGPGAWVISFAKDSNSTGTVYPQYAIEYAICVRPYGGP